MKNSDMRAKARAIFGPAIAEPMPNQPNGAKALQQRANARPIPTYKVGGPVNRLPSPGESVESGNRMSKMEAEEARFMEMLAKKKKQMPTPRGSGGTDDRPRKMEDADMGRKKMAAGGKVQTAYDTARKLAMEMGGMKKGGKVKGGKPKDGLSVMIAIGTPKKPVKKMAGGMMSYPEGGKPVKKMAGGMMSYSEGGKPVKKMNGGPMAARAMDMESSKLTRQMADGGKPMGYAAGGAGKTRKGQAPIKKAQGGAAKVRKGMMTQDGDIINAMNKIRGK